MEGAFLGGKKTLGSNKCFRKEHQHHDKPFCYLHIEVLFLYLFLQYLSLV